MTVAVREALPADLDGLAAIELSGEAMFAERGIVFPPGLTTVEGAIARGATIWVAEDMLPGGPAAGEPAAGEPVVGFAAIVEMDGHPHLEQISVQADQTGQGLGSVLLDDMTRRYGPGLTLLTYRDVPWNGPWYRQHGFGELPASEWGPELRRHWDAEVEAGLHDLGSRLVMEYGRAG